MSDEPSPPPLDYQPPADQPRDYTLARFAIGVIVGGVFSWVAMVITILFLFGKYHDSPAPGYTGIFPFIGAALTVALGLFLALNKRRRPFGLGLVASVPITVMLMFVICGGLR